MTVKWVRKDGFVMPLLPAELGIQPYVAAVLHAMAFLELSGHDAVNPDWAVEVTEQMAAYMARLDEPSIVELEGDLLRAVEYGRANGFPEDLLALLADFVGMTGLRPDCG